MQLPTSSSPRPLSPSPELPFSSYTESETSTELLGTAAPPETATRASTMPRPRFSKAALLLSMSVVVGGASAALDCSRIQADDHTFDLSALKGPHSVVTSVYHPQGYNNVTYTLDICAPLKRKEGVKEEAVCPKDTWVCGVLHHIDAKTGADTLVDARPIAGDVDGKPLEYTATRLSTSASDKDKGKEGVRLVLQGGKYENRKQQAVVELLCKEEVEGTEGEIDPEKDLAKPLVPSSTASATPTQAAAAAAASTASAGGSLHTREGENKSPGSDVPTQIKKPDAALVWESWGPSQEDPNNVDVLKLTWHTKHACEKRVPDGGSRDESKSWGLFTWIVILVFLGAAAYLIFGSWLNYNRYGARGWDLLPHGDTIRDVPYLLQDWIRRLLQTLQGGGSRGGYSAV